MKRYMQQESDDEVVAEPLAVSESDSDSEAGAKTKLGDRLFTSDEKRLTPAILREYAKEMDPKTLEQLIEKDSPELSPMLFELQDATHTMRHVLEPTLQAIGGLPCPKGCKQYLEMKLALNQSYCTFIAFYLLMKV